MPGPCSSSPRPGAWTSCRSGPCSGITAAVPVPSTATCAQASSSPGGPSVTCSSTSHRERGGNGSEFQHVLWSGQVGQGDEDGADAALGELPVAADLVGGGAGVMAAPE